MRVAITTTARNLDASFHDWCLHHLTLVDFVFVWLDDPHEEGSAHIPSGNSVQVRPGSQSVHPSTHGAMMHHQNENADHALRLCLEQKIHWLIHIDTDELIHCADRGALRSNLSPGSGLVKLLNHEVCALWSCRNPFRDCTYFKLNGRIGFNLYTNGKSAVRCGPGVWAPDAHSFSGYEGAHRTAADVFVLHYACPSYDRWLAKYAALGDFPSYWWDDPQHRIELSFHLASRDTYQRCAAEGNFEKAKEFWAKQVRDDTEIQGLLRAGKVGRFSPLDTLA